MNDVLKHQFDKVKQLADNSDGQILIKRTIDFTLDSQECEQFKKTVDLLNWIDTETDNNLLKERLLNRLDELYQILSLKPKFANPPLLVETENLTKQYKKSRFSLGPINLSLSQGEIIGLVGENGNGKTTLLRLLCRELQPTVGHIKYNFKYKNDYSLRSQLVYIPQRTPVWRGSLLDNLQFTLAHYGGKGRDNDLLADLLITRMGLRRFKQYSWKSLSSGYKMRFELTRALLRNPQILLIDEPLANLDILAQQTVLDDLKQIASSLFRPIGIVLSSQQLYEVERTSDNVIFLKDGQPKNMNVNTEDSQKLIIEFESPHELEYLKQILTTINLENIQINGGTYVAIFPRQISQTDFLQVVIKQQILLSYFRNISNSTRRFFLS